MKLHNRDVQKLFALSKLNINKDEQESLNQDLPEEEVTCTSWKSFQNKLQMNSSQVNPRDYYIIVLDKTTKKVHLQSLKSLQKLTSNGNNLPFQIKWKDNIHPVERNYLQSYDFLIQCYKDSVRKKILSHDGFENL